MPGLTVPMKPLADATYIGQGKRIPHDWSQPTGEASDHYRLAFKEGEHQAAPPAGAYLKAASTNRYHVDQAKEIGDKLKEFSHRMLDAFGQALDIWRASAAFQGIVIAGPVAIAPPGCLTGSSIESQLRQLSYPAATHHLAHWRDAVAAGLSQCFGQWQQGVSVPGLPWYPAFAACPVVGAAPPMPNVPTPLVTCASTGAGQMTTPALKSAMVANFSLEDPDDRFGAMALAIATAVSTSFSAWLSTQQVMMVMGTGPVPIAPGPVVGGASLPGAGHLAI
jgi:hypothetical protein